MADPTLAAAFLRDIIAEPDADDLRLIFADWLEEHGDEARAEFIRVQCELARMPAPWCKTPHKEDNCEELGVLPLCDWCALRRRERDLLQARNDDLCNLDRWLLDVLPDLEFWQRCNSPDGFFRRGFVAEVTLTLADWMGRECERCGGRGDGLANGTMEAVCVDCHGTGRTGGHADKLTASAPIEVVRFTEPPPDRAIEEWLPRRWPKITLLFP